MNKPNPILDKSFVFSKKIVRLYSVLIDQYKMYDLGRQILRSGNSIRANAQEAVAGISKKDFKAMFGISLKEARETEYWLRLLYETDFIPNEEFNDLYRDIV
jgi:four helix bundle protein